MATTETYVNAPPDAVFDVLSDASSYGHWVVGSSEIRAAESDWPEPGSTFHHTQGFYGRGIKDSTSVIASQRPRQLVLEVRTRPIVVAKVELRLRPRGRGTHVTMIEYPTGGFVAKIDSPPVHWLTHARNRESLRRLGRMAEERAGASGAATSAREAA